VQPITSASNPLLKKIRRALRTGELTPEGLCAIEGVHLLEEARATGLEIAAVFASVAPAGDGTFHHVPDRVLAAVASTETSPRVIALVRPPAFTNTDVFRNPALALILDGIQDPGNAGTLLRTAEAFGATGAVFATGTVSRWNPKTLRAAAGSAFRLPTIAGVVEIPVPLFAADPHAGIAPWDADWRQPCAIVVGSEAHGVSPALVTRATRVRIPTSGVESLNAAVAAAILLYEAAKQRGSV
jgi:TrmH family RNA methyltransferase